MKKTWIWILIVLLLLSGCAVQSQPLSSDSFLYYYPAQTVSHKDDGAFLTVPVEFKGESQSLETVVQAYLNADAPKGAKAVLPSDWTLRSVKQDNAAALLVFGGKSADSLSQSLAFACLAKTILQIPDIQRVSISYPGASEPVVLTENDIFLTDTGMLPQEEMLVLYFPDSSRRYLVRETVAVDAVYAADKPRCIVQQLLSSKEGGQSASCIPEGTELLGITVENGICTVNLSSQFSENLEQSFASERMAVYSIVNSLTELPEIDTVDFLISGAPLETLYLMDLSSGVIRDETILAVASEEGVSDITIYPLCDSSGLLAAIPLSLEIPDDQSIADAVLDSLMQYESRNGMRACIPAGTKLLSLRMENSVCVLDLTAEFLDGCTNENEEVIAVRSVVASMCALPGIRSVEILVEGREPVYRSASLSAIRQPDQSWFTE